MKILKSGVEMTQEELRASKAGKDCACACQQGFDTENMFTLGDEDHLCACGCIIKVLYLSTAGSANFYPY